MAPSPPKAMSMWYLEESERVRMLTTWVHPMYSPAGIPVEGERCRMRTMEV